ncbi:ATP-binding protein [Streptomyces vilmorinianum]|uniref:ATP-binding protein n=1 Tax=Streptomyces vilmorinianum TaxID=3051092 RepID=UPI0010FAEADF|nr:ATP-binding protein [Streptomyces vilmorinianum]
MTTTGDEGPGQKRRPTAQGRRFALGAGPGVVGECRDLARQALRDWFGPAVDAGGAVATAVDDVLLLVSEVVTNAYTHGGTPYELRIDHTDTRLWVQVSDTSPVRPRPHGPHRASRSSGHGLYLLERLSAAWGSVPRGEGKAVWFEVVVAPAGARAPAASSAADTASRSRRA